MQRHAASRPPRRRRRGAPADRLPPGTRGRYNAAELAAFLATKTTVPHCCDQLGMYRDLKATQLPDFLGDDGKQIQRDVTNYIAGINAYIAETRLDPTKLPGEYAALGHPRARSRGRRPT